MIRTYNDLSDELKQTAVKICLSNLLKSITEGAIRFNDELNNSDLQARIDKANLEADKMQTPWFAEEYIMDTCKDELQAMAQSRAEDALYPTEENFIYL
jgi:hypothetical protein